MNHNSYLLNFHFLSKFYNLYNKNCIYNIHLILIPYMFLQDNYLSILYYNNENGSYLYLVNNMLNNLY